MKKVILCLFIGISIINCNAQDTDKKFLMGASFGYTHDDIVSINSAGISANSYKNYTNSFEVSASIGYFLNSKSMFDFKIGYLSRVRKFEYENNPYNFNYHISGITLSPAYKSLKRITDRIWLYADCKIFFQYLNQETIDYELNINTYKYGYLNENVVELKYGLAVDPGIIFRLNDVFGIQMHYRFLHAFHSNILQGADSDIEFDDLNAWDYGINMNLSGLNLGFIAVF